MNVFKKLVFIYVYKYLYIYSYTFVKRIDTYGAFDNYLAQVQEIIQLGNSKDSVIFIIVYRLSAYLLI